jgi:flagellar L-ring protein precursor FlgH
MTLALLRLAVLTALIVLPASAAQASDLYKPGGWSALASDQTARQVGDGLTVVILESSTASNTARKGSRRNSRLAGEASAGGERQAGSLALSGEFAGQAQTERAGRLIAQINVTVQAVEPNGDLRVVGEQLLDINGEATRIALRGRVRPADIAADNTVVSSRIAEAAINYDGAGFVTRRSDPGVIDRIFTWLGLP